MAKYLEELATIDNPHFMRERKMLSKQFFYFANASLDLNVIFFASGLKVVLPLPTFPFFTSSNIFPTFFFYQNPFLKAKWIVDTRNKN